jgi:hypothetical protein
MRHPRQTSENPLSRELRGSTKRPPVQVTDCTQRVAHRNSTHSYALDNPFRFIDGMTMGWVRNERLLRDFAHRFRPRYAGANLGHPYGSVGPAAGLRGRPAVSHISRKTSEMWGTRRLVAGTEPESVFLPLLRSG